MARREQDFDEEAFGEASRYTAHLDRGWSLLERGDHQQARNSAHEAHKLRPEVPDAAMLMAAISLADGDPEGGLDWYERAIDADTEYVDAQIAAAQVLLYDLDEPQRALARAEQARELDEATPADLLDLGLLEVEALIAMRDHGGALARLDQLPEVWMLEEIVSPSQEPDRAEPDRGASDRLQHLLAELSGERDELDRDDVNQVMGRVVQLCVRLARLYIDLGEPQRATPWLEGLQARFGDDPDIWYMINEAAYVGGDPVRAAHAALQVLQLDARVAPPDWLPEPSDLHTKVVELLLGCQDPELRKLAREPGFIVVVNEAPPFEFVLEGVDPRARSLALAARSARDGSGAPILTGLALYRRNLLRYARDPGGLERELALAVFDELAAFFGFDDARRERLGLPPTPASSWPAGADGTRGRRGAELGDDATSRARSAGAIEAASADLPKKATKKKATKKKAAKKKATKKKATKKKATKKKSAKKKAAKKAVKKATKKKSTGAKKKAAKSKVERKPAKRAAQKRGAKSIEGKKAAEATKPTPKRGPSGPKRTEDE